jgi:hypothetical protein
LQKEAADCGDLTLFFTQQLATRSVDEMQSGAGWASQGLVGTARFIWRNFFCQPMLDVHTCPGTFEY